MTNVSNLLEYKSQCQARGSITIDGKKLDAHPFFVRLVQDVEAYVNYRMAQTT